MALNIPPDFGNLTFVFDVDGDPEEQTTSIGYAAPNIASALELSFRLAAFVDNVIPVVSELYTLDRMVDRYNDAGTMTEQELVANEPGLGTTPPLPSNCAVLVRKASAEVGRGKQGRMFVPGPALEDQIDHNGVIDATFHATLQTAFTGLFDDLNTDANTGITSLVVLHDEASPLAATPTTIGGLVVQDRIATQRRRMR